MRIWENQSSDQKYTLVLNRINEKKSIDFKAEKETT